MIWHKSMFSSPCKCCAAKDHGLLKIIGTNDGRKTSIFDCPVTCREDIVGLIDEDRMSKKYMPCPERFAYHFGCQEEAVRTALKSFDNYGAGKYMNGHEFTEFSAKAISVCEWYRTMATFKRNMPQSHHIEDIIFWEPEDEDSQHIKA